MKNCFNINKSNKKQKNKQKREKENCIELKDVNSEEQNIHLTTEEHKKFKRREIILLNHQLKNNQELKKYTWEKQGKIVRKK